MMLALIFTGCWLIVMSISSYNMKKQLEDHAKNISNLIKERNCLKDSIKREYYSEWRQLHQRLDEIEEKIEECAQKNSTKAK